MVAERGGRRRMRRGRGTPLEQAADQIHEDNTAEAVNARATPVAPGAIEPPAFSPPTSPELFGAEQLYRWERCRVMAAVDRFERNIRLHLAAERIPLDNCFWPIEYLVLFVQASLLMRLECPDDYEPIHIEGGNGQLDPRTETDALAHGLRIKQATPVRRAVMPGCRGTDVNGEPCGGLRVYGHELCPSCEAAEEWWRWEAEQM